MVKEIVSVANPLVKLAVSLQNKKEIVAHNLTLVEGEKIVWELLQNAAVSVHSVFVVQQKSHLLSSFLPLCNNCNLVSPTVANKMANNVTTDGVFALVHLPKQQQFAPSEPFLVLDHVQDPSNVGAIIRSALAFNFKQIVFVGGVYPYLPKIIRSSMGYVFSVCCVVTNFEEFESQLKASNATLLGATMQGKNIAEIKVKHPAGFVVGNEGNGVSEQMMNLCSEFVSIPMQNQVESLNVAISASIVMHQLQPK